MATGNVVYFFSTGRAQPYVTGGIGTLWSKGVASITFGGRNPWHITEQEFQERGLVWHIGTGIRLAVTRGFRSSGIQDLRLDDPVVV